MRRLLLAVTLLALAGCSGGAAVSPILPAPTGPAAGAAMAFTFTVAAPNANTLGSAAGSAASVAISVDGGTPAMLNFTRTGCGTADGTLKCSLSISEPAGNHGYALTVYSGTNGTGATLWMAGSLAATVGSTAPTAINIAFKGTAATVGIFVPPADTRISGSTSTSFTLSGNAPQYVGIAALDSAGTLLLGPTAPQVSLAVAGAMAASRVANDLTSVELTSGATTPILVTASLQTTIGGSSVAKTFPFLVCEPWLYVANAGSVNAYDESGNAKPLTNAFAGLFLPYDIAYDPRDGLLFVLDITSQSILAYNLMGQPEATPGGFAGLQSADAITYDTHDNLLYVAQHDTPSVMAFTVQGYAKPLSGSFSGLNTPQNIVFASSTDLLYTVDGNNAVLVFDENGVAQSEAGGFPGTNDPDGIAVDPHDGLIYVANGTTNSITAYNDQGFAQTLSGVFPNRNAPQNILYDPFDRLLYVANPLVNNTITAYDEQGSEITLSGSFAGLDSPQALTLVQ